MIEDKLSKGKYGTVCLLAQLVRDRFITLIKNRPLVAKKRKQISIYIKLSQPYPKTMEIFTRNNDTKNIRKSCWFVRNC